MSTLVKRGGVAPPLTSMSVTILSTYIAQILNSGGILSFVSHPQSKTVDEYALATFSCEVTGGVAPYTYQYKKNGVNVGTNSDTLSFVTSADDNGASITVVVTDSVGSVITSSAAVLGVTSYGFRLDGVTQKIQLSSDVVLTGDFDVSFRYKGTAGNYFPLLVKEDGTVFARIDAGGTMRVFVGSGVLTTSTVINDNVDRLISIVRVGQALSIKINGVTNVSSNSASNVGTVTFSKT